MRIFNIFNSDACKLWLIDNKYVYIQLLWFRIVNSIGVEEWIETRECAIAFNFGDNCVSRNPITSKNFTAHEPAEQANDPRTSSSSCPQPAHSFLSPTSITKSSKFPSRCRRNNNVYAVH